jgi:hypothetical protein
MTSLSPNGKTGTSGSTPPLYLFGSAVTFFFSWTLADLFIGSTFPNKTATDEVRNKARAEQTAQWGQRGVGESYKYCEYSGRV